MVKLMPMQAYKRCLSYMAKRRMADDARIYTLDGRFVGTDMSKLPRGIYLQGGKKIVK